MEREEWSALVVLVARLLPATCGPRFTFNWRAIVLTYLWAVVHNQPVSWACRPQHWPADLCATRLPTPATMSRRLRRSELVGLLERLLRHRQRGRRRGLVNIVDGKVLAVSRHSRDQEATFGGRQGGQRGYKLHLILGQNSRFEALAIHPLNVGERGVARELVRRGRLCGYLLGDKQYDDEQLYGVCATRGLQLIAPRQKGAARGLAHCRHSAARLRGIALLEASQTGFGPGLFQLRRGIERFFGQWVSAPYGLLVLPPWVRGLERVRRWATGKLVLFSYLRRCRKHAN
jgi:hypothetical protein